MFCLCDLDLVSCFLFKDLDLVCTFFLQDLDLVYILYFQMNGDAEWEYEEIPLERVGASA